MVPLFFGRTAGTFSGTNTRRCTAPRAGFGCSTSFVFDITRRIILILVRIERSEISAEVLSTYNKDYGPTQFPDQG